MRGSISVPHENFFVVFVSMYLMFKQIADLPVIHDHCEIVITQESEGQFW